MCHLHIENEWNFTKCAHNTFFAMNASPIGIYGQDILPFDKLVCRIIKERLSAGHMATLTEIILISEFHALH